MFVEIGRTRTKIGASATDIKKLRMEFDQNHALVLPNLIEPSLLSHLQDQIAQIEFTPRNQKGFEGSELTADLYDPLLILLHFLITEPSFLNLLGEITGLPKLQTFSGRFYRTQMNETTSNQQYLGWHDDFVFGRLLAFSLNLGADETTGGELELRHKTTQKTLARIPGLPSGHASLIRIGEDLEHCVRPLGPGGMRTRYAGWFYGETSDFNLRHILSSSERNDL